MFDAFQASKSCLLLVSENVVAQEGVNWDAC